MNELKNFSDELAGVVEALEPSVVRVEARRRGAGTGVAWTGEGLIITADHVLEREEGIEVGLSSGEKKPAVVVGRDPTTDVAVLRVEGAGGLRPAAWSDLAGVKVGHLVLALGRPGRTLRARMGVIGAFGESWRFPGGGGEIDHYLESDVGAVPGFSGGPLVDVTGKVLGINTAVMPGRRTITIPSQTIRRVVESLLAHGRIRRGYLGVSVQPVSLPARLRSELKQEDGLLVISVEAGSPAEGAGLLMGDTITHVDGRSVDSFHDLRGVLTGERIGSAVSLRIVRAGAVQDLRIVVGERRLKTA